MPTVRQYDFTAGTKIKSQEIDNEFNNLVTAVNNGETALSTHKTLAVLDHPDGSVTAAKLASDSVTTAKIAANAVTTDKIAPGALDNRYYTETEIDSPTRDHKGTWQGYTPQMVGDPILSQRIADLEAESVNNQTQTATVKRGLQTITVDRSTPFNVLSLKGLTLVNLNGRQGRIATSNTVSNLVSSKTYLVINEDMTNVTVDGVSQAVPHKFTGKTSVALSWSTGKVALYELDTATAAKIGVDPDYTGSKILNVFPYVDDVKHLKNPAIRKYGKNLLPPFTEWTIHANAKVVEPYKLQLDATAGSQTSKVTAPVIPGQTYNLSFVGTITGTRIDVYDGATYLKTLSETLQSTSFTPTQSTVELWMKSTVAGTFTFTNPQLELGSVATPFEPRNDEYLYLQTVLASNVDGSVYDSIFERDGQLFQLNRFKKDMVLDGNLAWTYSTDFTGFKRAQISNYTSNLSVDVGECVVKYDGKILKRSATANESDSFRLDSSGLLSVLIPDPDSGWGETYSPTAAEVQAYFYGYKMNNGTFGTPYNGTGTKTWTKITATDNIGSVTVTPTTQASGVDNYKLTYQLVNAVEEPITAEGSLMLHEGQNMVEVLEGVIVQEKVTFNTGTKQATTSKASANVLGVYKNGAKEPFTTYTSGSQKLPQLVNAVDSTADYRVSYLVLDKHLFTCNIRELTGQYSTNDKTVLNETVQDVADLNTQVSIHTNYIVDILVRLKAGGL